MTRLIVVWTIVLGLPVLGWTANPANTLTGTTVEHVDMGKQTVSIKTREGQSWTLRVADPELLKKHNLRKGDRVSVEVDTNNTIIKIAKAGESEHGGMGPGSSR